MKFYNLTIKPTSPFGTPLKGDTIFGHFCWQAAEDPELLKGGLESWIEKYPTLPFAVFSSAWPLVTEKGKTFYAMPRPSLPATLSDNGKGKGDRCRQLKDRKEDKKRKWLLVGEDLKIILAPENYRSDDQLFDLHLSTMPLEQARPFRLLTGNRKKLSGKFEQAHNSINRLTMTTGKDGFAPFSVENTCFLPGVKLAVFIAFEDDATDIKKIEQAFIKIGNWGYGRDASAGLGRFDVTGVHELSFPQRKSRSCYTLAPCVPDKNVFSESYFTPFIRFGKHGASLLYTGKPFKNPIVMADEGAIFFTDDKNIFKKQYIGQAACGLSKADKHTVAQGYSLYLPC
ncbi:MAG: hypothetical protein U9N60_00400 [Thermodesulfobacteriota bacterium]|nr:hypothetical protein [Thermodesulfobacteriota bacterium]